MIHPQQINNVSNLTIKTLNTLKGLCHPIFFAIVPCITFTSSELKHVNEILRSNLTY